jgi:hypothetical protein
VRIGIGFDWSIRPGRQARRVGVVPLRAAAMLLLRGVAAVPACKHTPPEQAAARNIARMQAAGEARDMDALFDPIAEDFAGAQGMDRKEFRRYMTLVSMRQQSVGVTLGPVEVKLFGDRATAKFTARQSRRPRFPSEPRPRSTK